MPDINGIPYVESTDLVSGWPTVSQSVAQEVSDQLASKVDYALPVNAQTGTTYTFVAADAEKLTTASNAAAVTLTIPPASSVAWPDNTVLRVVNYGAGAVTIDGGSGVTVTNTASTIAQYGAAVAIRTGSDAWTVVPFGGGDVPSATVSSPAATGQYTDGSGDTWDYYTFTSSGTLTVNTAGFADVLVVGGGGGGGLGDVNFGGGGGGGGGHRYYTDVYLSATSHTVTVGAGGSGNPGNIGGHSSVQNIIGVGGGGGGFASYSNENAGTVGGSGGGGRGTGAAGGPGITGMGNNGASGPGGANATGGGGGGAGGAGSSSTGGSGTANSITGSSVTRAAGGQGANKNTTLSAGGANTGNGGGGRANGGSGVVIVRVKV